MSLAVQNYKIRGLIADLERELTLSSDRYARAETLAEEVAKETRALRAMRLAAEQ
jgi:hypothetical protein